MQQKHALNYKELLDILSYNSKTGAFVWKEKHSGIRVDMKAGYTHNEGYLAVRINGRSYLCHRLAWLYMKGNWPKYQIDHINGNRKDNRIENLRECSNAQNNQNKSAHKDSKTGIRGVTWNPEKNKYKVTLSENGKYKHFGYFISLEEAESKAIKTLSEIQPFSTKKQNEQKTSDWL